ncbi:leucine-rich repeat protein [Butyrivibrio sp. AE3006]|uniref:leucine-rich repeat protein n=1 Tax=Butyrivibrio sp. AE3006 TaxID=1280673 RepID=UPI0003FAF07F|nr:leucine-rich repeat protein [Butyrivibrio sp. AE3006]
MKKKKRLLGILLSLALVLGLIPGMSLTAYADDDPYAGIKNTTTVVKFDNKDWYLIDYDVSTVTLLSKECVGDASVFSSNQTNTYSGSAVETAVNNYYRDNISTTAKTAVNEIGMFLLTTDQTNTIGNAGRNVLKCNQASEADDNSWWLCSPGQDGTRAAVVLGASGGVNVGGIPVNYKLGVRPALKLNLSSVIFSSVNLSGGANAAISGGTATQNYFDMGNTRGAMTTVTYTAKTGYKFPETSELYKETNGITVTKTSDTVITVSGTPTATATSIAVPDATDPLADAKTSAKANLDTLQSGKNQNDYDAADWTTLIQAIANGKTAIDNATTIDGISTAKSNAESAVNAVKTKAQKLADAKTEANATVNAVNATDYIEADQQTVTNAKTTALAAIEAATTEEGVTTALNNFNNAIASCTTQAVADQIAQVMSEVSAKTGSGMTYTGNPIQLINTPTTALPAGYTMKYAVTTEKTAPMDESLYTTSIPTATDAGTYYVWYKVVGDDSHTDSEPACVTVTIEEQKQSQDEGDDTQQNPDGTKTVTKENADGKTILVTNYSKTDEQISQFVFKKANGTKLDLKNVNSKSLKTVVVPATVKANGKTYKVTRIRKGFLKNCKQATKVDIGKNINTIDKNAFNYGKKVKKVVIRGKLKKVGKGAFKNTKKNVIIKVQTNAKNFEKNKKLLEKSGLPKNATVKRVKNKK